MHKKFVMHLITEENKQVVRRFNKECIEQGNIDSFRQLLSGDVVNHAARPGGPQGFESFTFFLNDVLRKGFPDIWVEILDQVAEGELVATRKKIYGTHTGEIMGIPATGKAVVIDVIDMIRVRDGRYVEHWGQTNFAEVLRGLAQ